MAHEILDKIGNTPLVEYHGYVPNNNRIWIKLECENPFGSHYDRVYPKLFKYFEEKKRLKPGGKVLETSTGSAGVSFAGIGRILGYTCIVAMPAVVDNARKKATQEQGAEIIETPGYTENFKPFLEEYLPKHRDVKFLNHSMGPKGTENYVTTESLESIAVEILQELGSVDYFVGAVGNGSSVLGTGRVFKRAGTKIVTFETFQSGVAYELLYPGAYREKYGIDPGALERHNVFGTSHPGIDFPHNRIAFQEERLVDETFLVNDGTKAEAEYFKKTGKHLPKDLPRWNTLELPMYGRSTRASLAVALKLAEREKGKNFVLLAYDKEDRYDSTT